MCFSINVSWVADYAMFDRRRRTKNHTLHRVNEIMETSFGFGRFSAFESIDSLNISSEIGIVMRRRSICRWCTELLVIVFQKFVYEEVDKYTMCNER